MSIRLGMGSALAVLATAVCGGAQAAPVQWTAASGGNDHYYDYVVSNLLWPDAKNAAAASSLGGQQGYLATITSQQEYDFILNNVSGAVGWAGGSDEGHEGTWNWVTGPEAGQTFFVVGASPQPGYSAWNAGEPNNCCGGENWLSVNWHQAGTWNDWDGVTIPSPRSGVTQGYFVEYGGLSPVPVPAALPLMGSALAALGLLRRKRAV